MVPLRCASRSSRPKRHSSDAARMMPAPSPTTIAMVTIKIRPSRVTSGWRVTRTATNTSSAGIVRARTMRRTGSAVTARRSASRRIRLGVGLYGQASSNSFIPISGSGVSYFVLSEVASPSSGASLRACLSWNLSTLAVFEVTGAKPRAVVHFFLASTRGSQIQALCEPTM